MKGSRGQLPSRADFRTFSPLNCSNFGLKQCKGPQSWQKSRSGLAKVRIEEMFPETITHRVFETCSSFHVEWRAAGKV